jgi:hypothetical protein
MLSGLSQWLEKNARGWLVLVFLALEIFFNVVILPNQQAKLMAVSGGTGPIDLQFFYTPEKVYSMVASYGDEGRASYRIFELTGDIIYPIVYTLLFSLLIAWLFKRGFAPNSPMRKLNVVPFGAWLFDLFENLGIATMLSIHPAAPPFVAWASAVFTVIKWGFAGASGILILIGLIMALKNGFKEQT